MSKQIKVEKPVEWKTFEERNGKGSLLNWLIFGTVQGEWKPEVRKIKL